MNPSFKPVLLHCLHCLDSASGIFSSIAANSQIVPVRDELLLVDISVTGVGEVIMLFIMSQMIKYRGLLLNGL